MKTNLRKMVNKKAASNCAAFKKTALASIVSTVTLVSGNVVFAQEEIREEVLVTGIRASIEAAMDIKREASGVVDAISAEDMGKFPDTNLAESLQRITGVSISRSDGEGEQITVRGFGPNDNLVTHNGRIIATTTGERGFNFANIAAEMINGVAVYKTSDAKNLSGAGGALVDISSRRPLDNPGHSAFATIKGASDESSLDSNFTPEFVGVYSGTFADDTIGVSVGFSSQERENGKQEAMVETGWPSMAHDATGWGAVSQNPDPNSGDPEIHINRPSSGIYSVPQEVNYRFTEQQRERINGQLVLQFAPSESFTATLDVDTYERTVATQHWESSSWFNYGYSETVFSDGPIATPLIYSETFDLTNPADISAAFRDSATKSTGTTIGLNLEFVVNDQLSLALDVAQSEAEFSPDSPWGTENKISTAAHIRTSATGDFTGKIPAIVVGRKDMDGNDIPLTGERYLPTGSWFKNEQKDMDIDQVRIDGEFILDDDASIDFGLALSSTTNSVKEFQLQRNNWSGVGRNGDTGEIENPAVVGALADAFEGTDRAILNEFDGSIGDFSLAEQLPGVTNGVLTHDGVALNRSNILNTLWMADFNQVRLVGEQLEPWGDADSEETAVVGDICGTAWCPSSNYNQSGATNREVIEDTQAIYIQYNRKFDINDMPASMVAGLRYISTDVESSSIVPSFIGAEWIADTEIALIPGDAPTFLTEEGDYSELLPNLALNVEVTDDVVFRSAYSHTIVRPTYAALLGGTQLDQLANRGGAKGNSGNPDLDPRISTNIDLSLEWYYDDLSFASFGFFSKKLENTITKGNRELHLFGLKNPASGEYFDAAIASGAGTGAEIRSYIFANFDGEPGVDAGTQVISGESFNDDLITNVEGFSNSDKAFKLMGFEFNIQHLFGASGFGAIFNYTDVESNVEFDQGKLAEQTVIDGVSDSMNLVGFYENYGFSVRLAYNYREAYYTGELQSTDARGKIQPINEDDYGQWDLSASYEFDGSLDGVKVFLEGINITDETNLQYGRSILNVLRYTQTGPRWVVGVSYNY